ncbi:unnamed protein product [Commensalibacter communis]|uniref:hypothetical protein n=1 Tax=Commensalibacter communis TaxID=2972786 RepID=UPI0022FFB80F|nr:hypothetical protein [Commensalibacter communis]CAI3941293.1 unnamed protein product [Commensalibacter communis]
MNSVINEKIQLILIVSSLLLGVLNAKAESDEVYFERKLPASDQIKILTINPVRMDPKDFSDKGEEKACKKWKITKAQIIRFFRLSINYSMSSYHHYSQTQCDITGKLIYNGENWDFYINGGATATWYRGKEQKYFGCEDKRCERLFITSYGSMN